LAAPGVTTLESDDDANERLYGKALTARDIVVDKAVQTETEGKPLVALLDTMAGKRSD